MARARAGWPAVAHALHGAIVRLNGVLPRLRRAGTRLGNMLLGSEGVVCVLQLVVAAELCMLGVGVVRRLESSYDLAYEASRMELALLEQQQLLRERNSGVAIIGAVGDEDELSTEEDATPSVMGQVTAGRAPLLRPRDVATIIAEDTGDLDMAAKMMMGDENAEEPAESEAAPQYALNPEDEEEVEALIRKGVSSLIAGDMRQSVLSFEQASAMAPGHPAMLYYYGLAYDKLLNPNKARDYYKKLLAMREQAGQYFDRAARRLTYGVEQGDALRGKLSFGPHKVQHTYDAEQGERVSLLLPVLLAPGEEIRADEVNLHVEFFDLVNGNKVDFAREEPVAKWTSEVQNWRNGEEDLVVNYSIPARDAAELSRGGDVKYYGFIAKLYYKGEPMDCISSPSALILHEQKLNRRGNGWEDPSGLLPDDEDPYLENAVPYSELYDETSDPYQ